MENIEFNQLGISAEILRALDEMGFVQATPIQAQAIPAVMEGRDVIVRLRPVRERPAPMAYRPYSCVIPRPGRCRRWYSALPESWPCRWPRS